MPDPLAPIRNYLAKGGTVYRLAKDSGVPYTTIASWLKRGQPSAVVAWDRVIRAAKKTTAGKP